ncbi:hypothetical protein N7539_006705 [Penicillium diatomitis]|uniref:Uncharacterized protein n=1 Tax=Penicillium diatomitis TaxID=2819901 RepID=A0A9W9X2X1_9EURO|nr:uncharacterized protein N7539_006705 [Penicillium diatomitis]KAJ5480811.1 hypothetical protein N7539_006705 [Penicillium diatomitis]
MTTHLPSPPPPEWVLTTSSSRGHKGPERWPSKPGPLHIRPVGGQLASSKSPAEGAQPPPPTRVPDSRGRTMIDGPTGDPTDGRDDQPLPPFFPSSSLVTCPRRALGPTRCQIHIHNPVFRRERRTHRAGRVGESHPGRVGVFRERENMSERTEEEGEDI